jgi:formylglycine-generating enzyme required for sulfatase activity
MGYRLPTDREFDIAIGDHRPSAGSFRNIAGRELDSLKGSVLWPWPPTDSTARGHQDPYPFTAPAGRARDVDPTERFVDLAGNVAEWCLDVYVSSLNPEEIRKRDPEYFAVNHGQAWRVVRGSSWFDHDEIELDLRTRRPFDPGLRWPFVGFRLVLTNAPERNVAQ